MGIDIATYRCRVGLFASQPCRPRLSSKNKYVAFCKGSDIHYRVFALGTILIYVTLCYYGVVLSGRHFMELVPANPSAACWSTQIDRLSPISNEHTCTRYGGQYLSLSRRMLLLSGDVEMNPGPEDTQVILDAINRSNEKVAAEIGAVRRDIGGIKDDLRGIKMELSAVRSNMAQVENRQAGMEYKLREVDQRIVRLEHHAEVVVGDMEATSINNEVFSEKLEKLERQMNLLESEKIKCNLRVFGLEEDESESVSLQNIVANKVLSVSGAADDLGEHVIESVKRIGEVRVSESKPRMVLIEFKNYDDKMKLFKYREELRRNSIRISNDISYNQRMQLDAV